METQTIGRGETVMRNLVDYIVGHKLEFNRSNCPNYAVDGTCSVCFEHCVDPTYVGCKYLNQSFRVI